MKTAIIYNSKTGFTEKYAMWLMDALDADCMKLDAAKLKNFDEYDAIIFGGWICAGKVSKMKWFFEKLPSWKDKKVAAFATGGSPMDNPDLVEVLKSLEPAGFDNVKAFYCPGGFNYEKMDGPSKVAMKMFVKALKKGTTEKDRIMAEMIAQSYDISDVKYIEPIVEYIKG